jgi:cytochrome bd ubiquinol oxidase subunit II
MSKPDVVAAVLWAGVTLYAVFGGADFGAGVWDLLAGGAERGARPRAFADRSLTPVWEANHVWLIFVLVMAWTAFPDGFAAVTSTLFVPLSLAALGIVLRGAGFAFRKVTRPLAGRRLFGAAFASSSVLVPFFMGTAVGAVATGRVPAHGAGDRLTSWANPTSAVVGALFVATGAYLAAVFLVADARGAGDAGMASYFRRRALVSAAVAGALAAGGLVALHEQGHFVYHGLVHEGLPLVIASGVCGAGALGLLVADVARGPRPLAVGAVATVVWGWGVAQHPYLLPRSLTIDAAAAPDGTLTALLAVFGAAVVVVAPALVLLYTLHQRSRLEEASG